MKNGQIIYIKNKIGYLLLTLVALHKSPWILYIYCVSTHFVMIFDFNETVHHIQLTEQMDERWS